MMEVTMPQRCITLLLLMLAGLWATDRCAAEAPPAATTRLALVGKIAGPISPKSVRSSGQGIISAHNMMYRHTVTIYDASTMRLLHTIPDRVQLAAFGYPQYRGTQRGAPVEGAYSPDGRYLYVTNYSMYGPHFARAGHDVCSPTSPYDPSFVYRIRLIDYVIDAAYKVGKVPKVVMVTPDNQYILVTNWCSYDLSVIAVATQQEIKRIKIGRYPRGIAISNDSTTAYIAEMGGAHVHVVHLPTWEKRTVPIGGTPRALVLSPDGKTLYATLNLSGTVVAFDVQTAKVTQRLRTGKAARSLDISADGSALFVVNFASDTITKIRTHDFSVLQTLPTCKAPIGVTYDLPTDRVWVACYKGAIWVYDQRPVP